MTKKILSVILALSFVFVFAACDKSGGDSPVSTTRDPFADFGDETTTSLSSAETATVTDAVSTTAPSSAATDEPSTEAKTAVETAATTVPAVKTTAPASKAPKTKAEIVAYFNTAVNGAKKNSKSITCKYMRHAVAGEIQNIPGALDAIAQKLIKANMGEDKNARDVVWTSSEDKNNNFPVASQTWASKLTPADVKSAQIKEANGKYMIRIVTVADPRGEDYVYGSGHAPKAFNIVLPEIINDHIPGLAKQLFKVGTVALGYPPSVATVTVDAASGRVLNAHYTMYWTIYIPLSGKDVILPFSTENEYIINW